MLATINFIVSKRMRDVMVNQRSKYIHLLIETEKEKSHFFFVLN